MQDAWLHFAIFTLIQSVFFIVHALFEKKTSRIVPILIWGIPIGIAVGILSDLLFGQLLGLWSYTLGFGWFFLHLNAAVTYGLFAAHTLLMQRKPLVHFFLWTVTVMVVYETTNHFFHIWTYAFPLEFSLTPTGSYPLLSIGYFVTALFIAVIWHIFGHRFLILERVLKRRSW